jgi:hypothetical protein
MLDLSKVTLVVVATRGHEMTRIAINDCLQKAVFGDVLIYTDAESRVGPLDGARYFQVPDWPNKVEAGRFYYSEAMTRVATPFGLLIEWDGGIYDPVKWRDDFFEYDYIGAPWVTNDDLKVGNGGFTLMSKRLGDFIYTHRSQFPCTTDWDVCRSQRPALERAGGFKWAPRDVAADFAWELGPRSPNNFGYHGTFNWPMMMERTDLIARARAMTDDSYLLSKMEPLIRKAPWLQQEIGDEAWNKYSARHK